MPIFQYASNVTIETGKTYPTKLGRMVHDRACVFIGVLFNNASRRLGKATKNGPVNLLVFNTWFPVQRTYPSTLTAHHQGQQVMASSQARRWMYKKNKLSQINSANLRVTSIGQQSSIFGWRVTTLRSKKAPKCPIMTAINSHVSVDLNIRPIKLESNNPLANVGVSRGNTHRSCEFCVFGHGGNRL